MELTVPLEQPITYCLYARKSSESDERQVMRIDSQQKEMQALAIKENLKVRIPNPHKSDIDKNLLNEILKEIGIDKTKWEEL